VFAGAGLTLLAVNLGPVAILRYAVLFFLTSSLLLARPQASSEPISGPVHTGSNFWGRVGLCSIAAFPLYWSIPEPTRSTFVALLLTGLVGWVGLQFFCWHARRDAPQPRLYRTIGLLCGLMTGMLLTLLIGESYFRYVFDASDSNGGLRTSRRWAERHVRFNSAGYRDREVPPAAELDGLSRIVLLGDSFAYGWGIDNDEDMLGPQLERELSDRVTPPPRVFTLAAGGIDTRREIAMFKADGIPLRPRVVVLTYHLNDADNLLPAPPFVGNGSLTWSPLTDNSDFLELVFWHAAIRCSGAYANVTDLPGMAVYQDPGLFGRQSEDLLALIGTIREVGAAPVVVLYPYLNAPVRDGPQRYALDRVAAVLAGSAVPTIDVSLLVDVNHRRFHANRFDPHPSPALHTAVVPTLAETVVNGLRIPPVTVPAQRELGSGRGRYCLLLHRVLQFPHDHDHL
jgi:hypothetical protein